MLRTHQFFGSCSHSYPQSNHQVEFCLCKQQSFSLVILKHSLLLSVTALFIKHFNRVRSPIGFFVRPNSYNGVNYLNQHLTTYVCLDTDNGNNDQTQNYYYQHKSETLINKEVTSDIQKANKKASKLLGKCLSAFKRFTSQSLSCKLSCSFPTTDD